MHKPNIFETAAASSATTQQQQQASPCPMPTPSATPWNLDAMPWKLASTSTQPGVVMEFDASSDSISDFHRRTAQMYRKRKSNIALAPVSTKQFISEEKITAHFNGLHISSDYIQHKPVSRTNSSQADSKDASDVGVDYIDNNGDDIPTTSTKAAGKCFTNLTYQDYQITAKELEQKLKQKLKKANRITMCEEIRKFHEIQKKKGTYLPESLLLGHVERPCTALVPWQPPPILELLRNAAAPDDDEEPPETASFDMEETTDSDDIDDFIDNNNTCSVDFNNVKTANDVVNSMDEDL